MPDPVALRIEIQRGDITALAVDAIVNAANESLAPGGGVCGAIHRRAGPELARACAAIGRCPTGDVVLTPGFNLPAKHVIHAVGPVWQGGGSGESKLLAGCYRRSLELCRQHGLQGIAFPAISTGIFGYPLEAAAGIAVATVKDWLKENAVPDRAIFCCFDQRTEDAYRSAMARWGR
ncbi:MAG TPA: O-acetyl-ADP-ribose deacetylase [Candidatus Cybelea sp.]|nr:O-acetyl-ADP-ribose deacetylase [Candidatus Cybelea sp.]